MELAGIAVADTRRTRMKGLLGRRSLEPGEGLLLQPAGSVHTAFMRFAIDVVFLDRDLRVLRVAASVRPWRAHNAGRRPYSSCPPAPPGAPVSSPGCS